MDYFCEGSGRSNIGATIFEEAPGLEPYTIGGLFDPTTDAWIETIYVDPRDRGNGYGAKMLRDFVNQCYLEGVRLIMGALVPSTDSDEAYVIEWYRRQGFTIIEPRPCFRYIYKELEY